MSNEYINRSAIPFADMEQTQRNAPSAKEQIKRINSPVCLHVHSVRKRLADVDGISAKAAIDGLVHAGVLQDDSDEFVKEIRYTQEKGEPEKTVINIKLYQDKCKQLEGA